MKQAYYRLNKLDKYNTPYKWIIGQRSNGKTYAVIERGIDNWINSGLKMAYIRRYKEDITAPNLRDLLNPQNIPERTGGEWERVVYQSRTFYAVRGDRKVEKSAPICDTFSLHAWERQKGADRGLYSLILFDEFMTKDQYLPHEVDTFLDVLSSLLRDRGGVPVYMVGNTVSQFCPYFAEFGFTIDDIKQGEIKQISPQLTVEYCNPSGKISSHEYFKGFSGGHAKMITSGSWDFRKFPRLDRHKNYNFLARFFIIMYDRKIAGEVRSDKNGMFLFFYPHTGDIREPDKTIIYSLTPSTNILHGNGFDYTPTALHIIIHDLWAAGKAFYSDNATGEAVASFVKGVI